MWFDYLVWGWIAIAVITFMFLLKIKQPYGRHTTDGWGMMVNNNWGWFWMELPALIVMPVLALTGPTELQLPQLIIVALWSIHYINRTLIFPFRLKTKGKKMPLSIVLSAVFFNGINGFVNGYFLGHLSEGNSGLSWTLFLGVALFFLGMVINQRSDNHLLNLRKENTGYAIPRAGLFNWISCPNYFGEIIEWTGFAIAAASLPAASFAIWTAANLIPRALNHHDWYQEKFEDYPKDRKAVIPYLV
ncbi:MAG: DUF1295 domain-containing protein [Cyclobacteriaceae bacterium]